MAQRKLADWLKAYLQHTQYSEAPESFHFWTGVGTIAAALRKKVVYKELYYNWTPNFYIIFVAKPGIVTKSTTINIGSKLLSKIKGIKFGADAITWQALVTELAASVDVIKMPDGSMLPMSCLTFFASEFGTLVDLQDRHMVNLLVDLWDGKNGAWKKATKFSGNDKITEPWINILAATTPSWLADNLPRQMIGGGFTSRCLFVFGERKRHLVAYPSRRVPNQAAYDKQFLDLLHDLEQISVLKGDVVITDEAYRFGEAWYQEHYKKMLGATEDIGGYLARKQVHMHKVAMVLSASQRDDLVITERELVVADKLLSALEADMFKVFQMIQTTEPMEKVTRLVELVRAKGKIPRNELYRRYFMSQISYRDFEQNIISAVQAGYIVEATENSVIFLKAVGGQKTSGNPSTLPGNASGLASQGS